MKPFTYKSYKASAANKRKVAAYLKQQNKTGAKKRKTTQKTPTPVFKLTAVDAVNMVRNLRAARKARKTPVARAAAPRRKAPKKKATPPKKKKGKVTFVEDGPDISKANHQAVRDIAYTIGLGHRKWVPLTREELERTMPRK